MFNFIKKFFEKTNEVQIRIDEIQTVAQEKVNTLSEIETELIETKKQLELYKDFYTSTLAMVKDVPVTLASDVKDETMGKLQHIIEFYKAQLVKVKAPRS